MILPTFCKMGLFQNNQKESDAMDIKPIYRDKRDKVVQIAKDLHDGNTSIVQGVNDILLILDDNEVIGYKMTIDSKNIEIEKIDHKINFDIEFGYESFNATPSEALAIADCITKLAGGK